MAQTFLGRLLPSRAILAIMESLIRDVRYALVTLRRTPGLTLTVLVTLALGVGAATAVFTIVHAVLLEPLPYADSAQLVRVWAAQKALAAMLTTEGSS